MAKAEKSSAGAPPSGGAGGGVDTGSKIASAAPGASSIAQALQRHARSYEDGQVRRQHDAARARVQCSERVGQAQRQLGRELSDLQRHLADALTGGDAVKQAQARIADACTKVQEGMAALSAEWQRESGEAEQQLLESWREAQAEPDVAQRAATLQQRYLDRLQAVARSAPAQQVQEAQADALRLVREAAESGQQIGVEAWRAYQDGALEALASSAAEVEAARSDWQQQAEDLQRRALALHRQVAIGTLHEWQVAWESQGAEAAAAA
jgi:hypothetical protein